MKKYLICVVALCLLLAMLPLGAFATEVETTEAETAIREPGRCGEDLTWSYDSGTLTISGSGAMDDYPDGDAPWLEYKDSITSVVFTGGVTSVGACAFADYDNLESVDFGSSMHTIGYRAFKSCDGLTSFTLPSTFRRFGEESFMSCQNLTEIRCQGGMPSFNANCVWDTYCTIFYPSNNPWPVEPVTQLFQAFQGRVQFFMGEGTVETSVEVTQPATKPTETQPAETVPETTAATVPVTEATEPVPETTERAAEATEAMATVEAEETVAATEEETIPQAIPEEEEKGLGLNGVLVGMLLITGTLSLILIGALIFHRRPY